MVGFRTASGGAEEWKERREPFVAAKSSDPHGPRHRHGPSLLACNN